MSKTIITGPAGCGKTHAILDEFEQALRNSSDPLAQDYFFLLPSAEHTERVTTLMLQRGLPGFFHRRVTTLSSLLAEIFGVRANFISNTARYLTLEEILRQNSWEYFQDVSGNAGLIRLLANFLAELKDSLIDAPLFRERMNALKRLEPGLAAKYEALAAVYEAYQDRLTAEGLRDRQDTLELIRSRKKGLLKNLRFKKIWLDGFFDFSLLQLEYLRELSEITEEMTIALTKDSGRREHLFEAPGATEKILKEMGFEIRPLPEVYHRSKNSALIFLERNLFSEKTAGKIPVLPESTLRIFQAVGIEGEIEMIAREIRTLYQSGGYRLSDFAILLRQIGHYEPVIRSVFSRCEIPVEIHERERLRLSPLVHCAAGLVKIFQNGWRRPDLINFLKSSYVMRLDDRKKDYGWTNALEHRALREGVSSGREPWLKDWTGQPGDKGLKDFNAGKKECLQIFASLEDELRNEKNIEGFKRILLSIVPKRFGIFETPGIAEMEGEGFEESIRRDAASMRRLEAILGEIQNNLRGRGRTEILFEDFADSFLRLVDLDLYSLMNRDKNRVQVYDVSLARQKEYRVVFVSGLLEKNFPVEIKEDPVLSDWERRLVSADPRTALRERLLRQNLERYLFYLAVTRATERLILTFPRLDREGRELLPSFYLEEVRSLFDGKIPEKKQDLAHPYPALDEVVSRRELEIALLAEHWNRDADRPRLLYLTNHLLEDETVCSKFRRAFGEIKAELADPAILSGDFFRAFTTSPTRLEEYAKCPYKYFAHRILKLQDPEEEVNVKQKGKILHQVLENFFQRRLADGHDLFEAEKSRDFVLCELQKAIEENPLVHEKRYQLELDYEEMKDMLLRFLEAELARLRESAFQPRYFEFGFGRGRQYQAEPLELEVLGRKAEITGKIDRIDADPSQQYGLVIDYKRTAQFKKEDLELGTALQLPVYLLAMEKFLKLKPAGGELYSLKERKKRGFYHAANAKMLNGLSTQALKFSDEAFQNVMDRSMNFIRHFVAGLSQAKIPVLPRYCDPYCPYPAVCRIEKWKLASILEEVKEKDQERLKTQQASAAAIV